MKKNGLKIAAVASIVVISILILKYLPYERIRNLVQASGSFGALVYILMFTILPVFFFPVPVLAFVGGVSFGLLRGSIYTIIGAFFNCAIMFLLARFVAREKVLALIHKKMPDGFLSKLETAADSKVFYTIFILRLIPVVPYNIINYGSGLTSIDLKSYLVASVLGIIPGTVVFINVGDKTLAPGSSEFYFSVFLLIALIAVSLLLAMFFKRREQNKDSES